jgi:hypothetical protein
MYTYSRRCWYEQLQRAGYSFLLMLTAGLCIFVYDSVHTRYMQVNYR